MKAFYAVAVLAAVIAAANAKATIQEEHPIDWYDCSGKPDGNYLHTTDCTRFLSCSGGIASQRDCPSCHIEAGRCPDVGEALGRLIYNSTEDKCLYGDKTTCVVDPGDGDGNSTQGPSSTTDGVTETTEAQTTAAPTTEAPTTEAPTTEAPTTQAPITTPIEGGPCDPQLCLTDGYCTSYLRCDKNSSTWVREQCGGELLWNPLNPNGTKHIHGGNCDIFENLRQEVVDKYREDPNCLGCYWNVTQECSQEYIYQPPNGTYLNPLDMTCANGLVFSLEKETCQICQDVQRKNGNGDCCSQP